jgi:hypothetical protein
MRLTHGPANEITSLLWGGDWFYSLRPHPMA